MISPDQMDTILKSVSQSEDKTDLHAMHDVLLRGEEVYKFAEQAHRALGAIDSLETRVRFLTSVITLAAAAGYQARSVEQLEELAGRVQG